MSGDNFDPSLMGDTSNYGMGDVTTMPVTSDPYAMQPTAGMVDNGNGTFTDPTTGQIYDANGTPYGPPSSSGANPAPDQTITPSSGSGSGLNLSSLASALGISPSTLSSLLPMLAALGSGIYSANQTTKATGQVQQGITNAQNAVNSILGPGAGQTATGSNYAPYIGMGQAAVGKLGNFAYQPLAPQFGNLSTQGVNALPTKLTLGTIGGGK